MFGVNARPEVVDIFLNRVDFDSQRRSCELFITHFAVLTSDLSALKLAVSRVIL
jgi:hypothetical protein